MSKIKLRSEDPVIVITGKDKGKKSKIVKLVRKNETVYVENINMVKRHMKPNQFNPDGGIVEKEMPIDISNIMYYCKKCDKGVRLGVKALETGQKIRFCRSCGETIDKD